MTHPTHPDCDSDPDADSGPESFPTRLAVGLFLAAFLLRILPAGTVFWRGEVMLRDADATYHLRRVFYFIENFPSTLDIDPYVQFPHGSKIIWPGFLDVCFGLLLWPVRALADLAGRDWMHAVSVGAAWLPPLIGAATIVAVLAITRRQFGLRAGLISGALLCVLGGHWVYSQLGALDHHVVVSLVSVLILGSMLDLLSPTSSTSPTSPTSPNPNKLTNLLDANHTRHTTHSLQLGLWAGIGMLVWPGNLLYVGIALLGLAVAAVLAPDAERMHFRFRALAIAGGLATLIIAPFSLFAEWPQWSSFSPVVLTNFQPWILACAALVGLFGIRLAGQARFSAAPALLSTALVAFSGTILVASFLVWSGLSEGLADAWQWLGKGEEFQASVIESQGLFVVGGEYTTFMATLQLSPLLYLFPLIWCYGVFEASRSEQKAARVFLLVWALVLFAITLLQKRFVDTFSVVLAIQTGLAASDLFRLARSEAQRKLWAIGIAAVSLFVLYALYPNYTPHVQNLASALRDEPPALNRFQRADFIMSGVGRWIRESTPPTSGWLDKNVQPEYGILASWGHGHMLQHIARRPAVTDNFGDDAGPENFEREKRFWSSPNKSANAILEELGVRYVIVTGGNARLPGYSPDATYRSLYLYDGSRFQSKDQLTPASPRYRLVMESQKLQNNLRYAFAKVFEFVPGARVQGRTRPGQRIRASVQVRTTAGRDLFYVDEQVADAEGAFEFRVSYPNTGGPAGLVVASGYRILCGTAALVAEVSETDVQSGAQIWIDDPCASAAQSPLSRRSLP